MTDRCKHADTEFVDGRRTCKACGKHVIRIGDAVAAKGFSPYEWQRPNPANNLFGARGGPPVGESADLDRILALPRRKQVLQGSVTAEALIELVQDKLSLGSRSSCKCREHDPIIPDCITRLLWIQAWMLHEISTAAGLIGAVPVGGGKELVGILAPMMMPNCRNALLLMPASLIDQVSVNWKLAAEHFRVPKLIVHAPGGDVPFNKAPGCAANAPTLHVMAYTKLSSVKSSDWIASLQPDTVIANECDALKDLTSARTMRVMRYFAEHGDHTRFCGWTGSLTDNSVSEYAHLSLLALRERSPMPMSREAVEEWGRCLDAVPCPAPPGELIRLCAPGESVRQGFRRRLAETEGFVMVGGEQIIEGSGEGGRVHLQICERKAPELPDIVRQALDFVRRDQRPDTLARGEWDNSPWPRSDFNKEIEDPLEKVRLLKEVASGMFYRWVFPEGEPESLIKDWFGKRKRYVSESREIQLLGEVHLDSPKLVEKACMRGWGDLPEDPRLPSLRLDGWPDWRDIRDKVKPKSAAVRLHPYIVDDAAAWAREQVGIIWYMMQEFADWVAERHRLPVFGGGMGEMIMKETGARSILASIKAHGRGRDRLQYSFHEQIVPQVPSSSRVWEQLLGRLHRRNQRQDVVRTHLYLNTPELRQSYEQAMRRAQYVEETTGAQQKLTVGWQP